LTATCTRGQTVVYDRFCGSALDHDRWRYLELQQGDGELVWTCFEKNALARVGEGTLDIDIERFATKHNTVQVFDNLKHQLVSTDVFCTQNGSIGFALDMAATRIGRTPTDYRDGFASFMLLDERTGWSFSVCTNGKQTFGLSDALRKTYRTRESTHVFDAPPPSLNLTGTSRHHTVILDSERTCLEWWVDGEFACRVPDAAIPPQIAICLGVATLSSLERIPVQNYSADSGLSVSFGPISIQKGAPDTPIRIEFE
jgi:Family of unknown function (DUF6081)